MQSSYFLYLIFLMHYFTRYFLEIGVSLFFSPSENFFFFPLWFPICALVIYLYTLYKNCTRFEINRTQPEFKLSRTTLHEKTSHSAFQRSNTLIPGNIFSWNVGKPKPVPTLSNHCFSYVNFVGKNASLHMQRIAPRLFSKTYMVQVS